MTGYLTDEIGESQPQVAIIDIPRTIFAKTCLAGWKKSLERCEIGQ